MMRKTLVYCCNSLWSLSTIKFGESKEETYFGMVGVGYFSITYAQKIM